MKAIEPGGTIGIIGGGQLGRMIALEARRMGYKIAVLDPDPRGPAGQVADTCVQGEWSDVAAARALAAASDVVTVDTEHVPADLLAAIEPVVPVRPGASVLRVVQDRLEQRRFLGALGVPQPRIAAVSDAPTLRAGAEEVGFPCILKARRSGYDGKGQARAAGQDALLEAWTALGCPGATLEPVIDFEMEIAVLLARDLRGAAQYFPVARNVHRRHVLETTTVPAKLPEALVAKAEAIAAQIAGGLEHVGVMAVEMFVTRDGELLVNEIAPRTHNSGHFTWGACATSQFEQHVRAICGLPLGDPSLLRPAVMINLLGDLWQGGEPPWASALAHPTARLHLYGKARASPGRKMGHVLVVDEDLTRAEATAHRIVAELAHRG